jgi:very-short-patch-repair endonuclease
MDFLLLMPNRQRVVIEVNGVQHYSQEGQPSPQLYAEMVSEDRQLRLAGYEIYRFGGFELTPDHKGRAVLSSFFSNLLKRHKIEEAETAG